VVLADAEDVEADFVGKPYLFEQIGEPGSRVERLSGGRIRGCFSECR